MTINEFARTLGVSQRAVRFYESKGLLSARRNRSLGSVESASTHDLKLTREMCVEQIMRLEARACEINEALAELRQMMSSGVMPPPTG